LAQKTNLNLRLKIGGLLLLNFLSAGKHFQVFLSHQFHLKELNTQSLLNFNQQN